MRKKKSSTTKESKRIHHSLVDHANMRADQKMREKTKHRLVIDIEKVDDDTFVGIVKWDTLQFPILATDFVQGVKYAVKKIFTVDLEESNVQKPTEST